MSYWAHFFESTGVQKIHSPFVFQFYMRVLRNKRGAAHLGKEKQLPSPFVINKKEGIIKDSKTQKKNQSFLFRAKYRRLFQRMIPYLALHHVLEIGDCAVPSLAFDFSNIDKKYPIRGGEVFDFKAVKGEFSLAQIIRISKEEEIPESIKKNLPNMDMVYIEGENNTKRMFANFETCIPQISKNAVLVLGGINDSEQMKVAWMELKRNDRVTFSIDLYHLGLVFFRKEMKVKQHFKLRY